MKARDVNTTGNITGGVEDNGSKIETKPVDQLITGEEKLLATDGDTLETINILLSDASDFIDENINAFSKDEHINVSEGVSGSGKPIILNPSGTIDPTLINAGSAFYFIEEFDPAVGAEYPLTAGLNTGAFWVIETPSPPFTFTGGDLNGQQISNGQALAWGFSSWAILDLVINPDATYLLDGSNALTADFQAGGNKLVNVANGVNPSDAVNVTQLASKSNVVHNHNQSEITDLEDDLATKFDKSGGTISGTVNITEAVTLQKKITSAPTVSSDSDNTLATKGFAISVAAGMPVGAIIMWAGGLVPANFVLCDGTNGTPNLIDKFIRAGVTSGTTGGSDDAVAIDHYHAGSFNGNPLSNHSHTYEKKDLTPAIIALGSDVTIYTEYSQPSTSSNGAGTPSGNITVNSAGVSGTGKNVPSYYALMFIMYIG